jgi:SAM-dependent methyltransferase
MRWLVAQEFEKALKSLDYPLKSIAVVGGTSKDLEVSIVGKIFSSVEVSYFGIDNPHNDSNFGFLDLNILDPQEKVYDLVLCSQVIEHVHNLENAFKNLRSLMNPINGFIWLNCPASNMPHGSPDYFSAGYSKEYIDQIFQRNEIQTLRSGYFGSKRFYFLTHALHYWATQAEHLHPVLRYEFQPGTKLGVINKWRKEILWRFLSIPFSSKIRTDLNYATEVWALGAVKK